MKLSLGFCKNHKWLGGEVTISNRMRNFYKSCGTSYTNMCNELFSFSKWVTGKFLWEQRE